MSCVNFSSDLHVRGWVLVAFGVDGPERIRFDERHLRQGPVRGVGEVLRDREHVTSAVVLHVLEQLLHLSRREIDLPADRRGCLVERLEDRLLRVRLGDVARVSERRAGQQVEAVGERRSRHRGEVAIGDRELVRDAVVEGQRPLVVVAHRPATRRIGRVHVLRGEAVHATAVDLVVRRVPPVVEVGGRARVRRQERMDRRPTERVRVRLLRLDRRLRLALEVQPREVRVVRPVLLHQDHNMIDAGNTARRRPRWFRHDTRYRARQRRHGSHQRDNAKKHDGDAHDLRAFPSTTHPTAHLPLDRQPRLVLPLPTPDATPEYTDLSRSARRPHLPANLAGRYRLGI